jgi:uncharacterized surface protein with fasciclin (FAS1) repeats
MTARPLGVLVGVMKTRPYLLAVLAACGPAYLSFGQDAVRSPSEGPVVPAGPVQVPDRSALDAADAALPTPPGPTPAAEDIEARPDVVTILSNAADFTTLVSAMKTAGLDVTLLTGGPYTVFAPTNAAFEALPDGLLTQLLQPENRVRLSSLLAYHVVPGQVMMAGVAAGPLTTMHGATLNILVGATGPTVNEIPVSRTDIAGNNGIIHVVNRVMIPPELLPPTP